MRKRTDILLMVSLLFTISIISSFVIAGTPCGSSGIHDSTCTITVQTCTWDMTDLEWCKSGFAICANGGSCGPYIQCSSCGGAGASYPYNCYQDSCTGTSVCNNAANGFITPPASYDVKECYYISSYSLSTCQNAGGGVGYRYAENPVWSHKSGSSCSNVAISDDGPYSWSTAGDIVGCCEYQGGTFVSENSAADCPPGYNDGSKGCCVPGSDCFYNGACYGSSTKLGAWPSNAYCSSGTWHGGDDSSPACNSIAGANLWHLGTNEVPSPACCGDDSNEYVNYQKEHDSTDKGDISWFVNDNSCCNNKLDNVGATNNCVDSSALVLGSSVPTGSASMDIRGISYTDGVTSSWMECDLYASTWCNDLGNGTFALSGENGVGEYQLTTLPQKNGGLGALSVTSNEFGFAEACGDDSKEYLINTYVYGSNGTFISGPYERCCDTSTDCVNATGHCIDTNTILSGTNGTMHCYNNIITRCDDEYRLDCDTSGNLVGGYRCTFNGFAEEWEWRDPADLPPECCGDSWDNDCDETCEGCSSYFQTGCDQCFNRCVECASMPLGDPRCSGCVDPCLGCTLPTDPGCSGCFDPCISCTLPTDPGCSGCFPDPCTSCTLPTDPGCSGCFDPCISCTLPTDPGCLGCFDPCFGCTHPTDPGCLGCFDPCFDCRGSSDPRCTGCSGCVGKCGGDDGEDTDCVIVNGTVYEEIAFEYVDKGYDRSKNGRYYNISIGANIKLKYSDDLTDPVHGLGDNVTDSKGHFNMSINASRGFILYANKDINKNPLSIQFPLGVDQENLELFLGSSSECRSDCSIQDDIGRNICSKDCDGFNGCKYAYTIFGSNGQVKDICNGKQAGWIALFNSTYEVSCCNGEPYQKVIRKELKVDADNDISNILTYSKMITLNGELVTMYITTWEER